MENITILAHLSHYYPPTLTRYHPLPTPFPITPPHTLHHPIPPYPSSLRTLSHNCTLFPVLFHHRAHQRRSRISYPLWRFHPSGISWSSSTNMQVGISDRYRFFYKANKYLNTFSIKPDMIFDNRGQLSYKHGFVLHSIR